MKKAKFIFLSSVLFFGSLCFAQEAEKVLIQNSSEVQEETKIEETAVLENEESVSSQDDSNFQKEKSPGYIAAESTIKKGGMFFKVTEVQPYLQALNLDEKKELYSEYKKSPLLAGLLNGFAGFGVGSFVQKDWIGGTAFLLWDSASIALILGGYLGIQNLNNTPASTPEEAAAAILAAAFVYPIVIVTGAASFLIARGVAAGVGVAVSNSYNKKLQNALSLSKAELSFVPVYSKNNDSGIALRVKF